MSNIGTVSRGIKMPLFKQGDDIANIIANRLIDVSKEENIQFKDNDIICVTESIIARSEGNYVTVDDIADEIVRLFGKDPLVGIVWPIYSRNRFSMILKGIARAAKKVVIQLKYGKDEVGNSIFNPWTGVDIISFYRNIIEEENAEAVIMQSNNLWDILLPSTGNVIIGTIHTRWDDKHNLQKTVWDAKADYYSKLNPNNIITLDEICINKTDKHGYNEEFGLLGSNKATEEKLKLFPTYNGCKSVCEDIKKKLEEYSGKDINVMVYGDGCFKDPVRGIWEFADPVASPYSTNKDFQNHSPNEIKMKYLLDMSLEKNELPEDVILNEIKNKEKDLTGNMASQGTTPRRYCDLLASLADLTSGSGDKGTPVIWIQGYFNNYIN